MAPEINCPRREELTAEVEAALQKIIEASKSAQEAIRGDNEPDLMRFDRELESAVGRNERALGALEEHKREHGC